MELTECFSPEQLKRLSPQEVEQLLPKLRERITEVVARNGGHLASNLGVVELTVALHRVFDAPKDKIIFDVGHQCYTHKILTERGESFDTLRAFNGISGFPKCSESAYDAYGTGHASTALSAALGMARAMKVVELLRAGGGLPADIFVLEGRDEKDSPHPNDTPQNKMRNRTVIVQISDQP